MCCWISCLVSDVLFSGAAGVFVCSGFVVVHRSFSRQLHVLLTAAAVAHVSCCPAAIGRQFCCCGFGCVVEVVTPQNTSTGCVLYHMPSFVRAGWFPVNQEQSGIIVQQLLCQTATSMCQHEAECGTCIVRVCLFLIQNSECWAVHADLGWTRPVCTVNTAAV